MRELTESEVEQKRRVMGGKGLKDEGSAAERWWTFEHGAGWREAERQFLGAVGSHGKSSGVTTATFDVRGTLFERHADRSRRLPPQIRISFSLCSRFSPTTLTPSFKVRRPHRFASRLSR